MNPLLPCPSCARHVKSSEAACPFCSASLSGKLSRRAPTTTKRLERLAAFTFAAALAVTGCAVEGDEPQPDQQESELGGFHAMYGMPPPPPVDAGTPCLDDKNKDNGGFAALYGMPPVEPEPCKDAGPPPCDNNNDDHGGFAALYGMPSFPPPPPPPCTENKNDAGAPDPGGFHPMYGMPPAPQD